MATLTLVFSNHRPESLPFAADLMRMHRSVILEEPPDPTFPLMLARKYSIDAYVSCLDTEYPEFSRRSCRLFQELHAEGVQFYQVEPFLEQLWSIHQMFSEGKSPGDIPEGTRQMAVYLAEKKATHALIDFYQAAVNESFEAVIEALKNFARADADRFRLRDQMRAKALAEMAPDLFSAYIEAGTMHLWLRRALRRRCLWDPLTSLHLMAPLAKARTGKSLIMGPGDVLTLIYIFNPADRGRRCDRLAARSLVFNKIVGKVEMSGEDTSHPHLVEEIRAGHLVRQLTIEDCAALFADIRTVGTHEANERVMQYVMKHRKKLYVAPINGAIEG